MKPSHWLFLAPLLFAACAQPLVRGESAARLPYSTAELVELAKNPYATGGGMWTFHNPPPAYLQKRHHFSPTQEWLDAVRLSCVRFPNGSASFISPDGLVLTNHHVGLDSIQKASSAEHDYVKNGFIAASREQEIPCAGLVLRVFVSMENVTQRVKNAAKDAATPKAANEARTKEIGNIVTEARKKSGMRCEVSNLYQGGEFWLYQFKEYKDCRLVFAPEQQIAFYGGDPDNFTYPRYDLDFSLFRVYEDGKPAKTPNYFKFSVGGAKDGELVFVAGNPGSTARLNTIAQMEYLRDHAYPRQLEMLRRQRDALVEYSKKGAEQERQAKAEIFGIENSIKAITGYYGGLLDPKLMGRKRAEESYLKAQVLGTARIQGETIQGDAKFASLKNEVGDAWAEIEKTRAKLAAKVPRLMYTNISGDLASAALALVRFSRETAKPDAERSAQFRDANLDGVKAGLLAENPIYLDMEEARLVATLKLAAEKLPKDDPFVVGALGGKSAESVARAAVRNTQLKDMKFRKQLLDGGSKAIDASQDPMLALARVTEPILRELQKWREDEIDAIELGPLDRIAKARFAVFGHTLPPDANFTLRLSPGVVRGYEEDTTLVPYKTTMYGLYERSNAFDDREPFNLPQRWKDAVTKLNLATPYNFVNTCDIIGGNSGSPVINKNRELVGLIFDGNIQSLPNRFLYDDVDQRAVAVHPAAIVAALRTVYDAGWIADEVAGK